MAKMTRERTVKERRARKQEKKQEKKLAAEAARSANAVDSPLPARMVD
jgi:hypothetical protein